MDKNKQMKKKKPNIKIISASLLVIILVSMLAIPTSAVDDNSIIGTWVFTNNYSNYNVVPDVTEVLRVTGSFYVVFSNDEVVSELQLIQLKLTNENGDCRVDISGKSPTTTATRELWLTGDNNTIFSRYGTNNNVTTTKSENPELYNMLCTVEITSESDNPDAYELLDMFADKQIPPEPKTPLGNILDVFLGIGGWIATAVTSLIGIFYSAEAGKLTVIGVLSVASLAISVIFLLIGVIQNFMHFRS